MHDQITIDRFIALRADGWSYDKIAQELKVSRQTLINWGRKYKLEIRNLTQIKTEALKSEYGVLQHRRIEILGKALRLVEIEIGKSDLSQLPPEKKFDLLLKLVEKLKEEEGNEISFTYPPDPPTKKLDLEAEQEGDLKEDNGWLFPMSIIEPAIRETICKRVTDEKPWNIVIEEDPELKSYVEGLILDHQKQTVSVPNLDQNQAPESSEPEPKKRLHDPL